MNTNNNIVALATDANFNGTTGRLCTFTLPEAEHNALLALADRFGIRVEAPLTGWGVALGRAVEDVCSGFRSGHYRWVPRSLKLNVYEIVEEVLLPHTDGEVKGERRTIGRFNLHAGNGQVTVTTDHERLRATLEEGKLASRLEYHRRMIPANLVGDWADKAVQEGFAAIALVNRGHSFHVLARDAERFDNFLDALVNACGGWNHKKVKVSSFRVVDNSPETLASLVRSARASAEDAVEAALLAVEKATTRRGVEGAVTRLKSVKGALDAYKTLLGTELDKVFAAVDKAADALLGGEVALNFAELLG